MSDLFITGWKAELQTISLIRLVRANSALGLKEAQQAVRGLMGGKEICLSGLSDERAAELRKEIESLNAICR